MKLGVPTLLMCALVLAVVCFAGGFFSAVLLGRMDTATASAVASTAIHQSETVAFLQRDLLNRAAFYARSPVYAVAELARKPVEEANRKLPGALSTYNPLQALDQTISGRAEATVDSENEATGAVTDKIYKATDGSEAPAAGEAGKTAEGKPSAIKPADGKTADGKTADGKTADGKTADGKTAEAKPAEGKPAPAGAVAATKPAPAAGAPAQPAAAAAQPAAAPPPVKIPTLSEPGPAGGVAGAFTIELGSFLSADTAQAVAADLAKRGLPVVLVQIPDAGGRVWQHVRVGTYPNRDIASLRLAQLQADQGLAGTVVAAGKATPVPDAPAQKTAAK